MEKQSQLRSPIWNYTSADVGKNTKQACGSTCQPYLLTRNFVRDLRVLILFYTLSFMQYVNLVLVIALKIAILISLFWYMM